MTGTLFAPGAPDAIAEALAGLFDDRAQWPARREAARAYVLRERGWATNIARYAPVYHGLTGRHPLGLAAGGRA
ncbi:glycosyltransferase [Sphingomonas flavalba]|uniref:glycosyltransferase n=1 Tax=Sphingomonas flavalba TaxID=2559804 RepID=UPI0039E1B12F